MMKNGMYVICANSIEEAERDLEMMKLAASLGQPLGSGGMTLDKAETALNSLREALGYKAEKKRKTTSHCECDDPYCGCHYNRKEEYKDEESECEEEGDELSDLCDTLGAWFADKLYAYAIGEAPVEEVRRETTKAIREVRDFMN